MENDQPIQETKGSRSIQEYLSLGYIYLLVLGVSSYSLFYGFLGINVISYSSVLDIMLSPVIIFTDNIIILIALIVMIVAAHFYTVLILRFQRKKLNKMEAGDEIKIKKLEKGIRTIQLAKIFMPAIVVFSMYIGYAVGGGVKTSDRIKVGNLRIDHLITYNDGETVAVELIGHNSQYVFYVAENSKELTVSPVVGNIKKIEQLKD